MTYYSNPHPSLESKGVGLFPIAIPVYTMGLMHLTAEKPLVHQQTILVHTFQWKFVPKHRNKKIINRSMILLFDRFTFLPCSHLSFNFNLNWASLIFQIKLKNYTHFFDINQQFTKILITSKEGTCIFQSFIELFFSLRMN